MRTDTRDLDLRTEYEAYEPRLSIRITQEQSEALANIFTHQGDKSKFFQSVVQDVIDLLSREESEKRHYLIYLVKIRALRLGKVVVANRELVERLLGDLRDEST